MVALRLELDNVTNLADGGPTTFVVEGRRSVDIGRNSYLDWTLPDPTRVVSGRHCEIKWRDGGYWITDVSTNGTFLNGSDSRLTEPWRLTTGDRITIGEYLINVVVQEDEASARGGEAPSEAPASEASANLWEVPGERAAPSEATPVRARESRPVQADVLDWVSDLPAVEPQTPHAAPEPPVAAPASPPAPPVAEPDEPQPSWSRAPSAAPSAPEPPAARVADPVSAPQEPAEPAPPAMEPPAMEPPVARETDRSEAPRVPPEMAPGPAEPAQTPPGSPPVPSEPKVPPTLSTTSFERAFSSTEPEPEASPAAVPPASEEPAYKGFQGAREELPPASGDGFERFAAALAAQLGLPRDRLEARSPEALAEEVGTFIHLTTLGLQKLLKARSQSRGYMKAGAGTQIQAIGNNPFKYMPTPSAAADVLFGPQSQAYLSTRDAIEESFADLGTHQMALYAAMQAAVERMLKDLDPASIEDSAGEERGSFGLGSGKSKMWEIYKERYNARASQHDNGMVDVFMMCFSDAYGRQTGDK